MKSRRRPGGGSTGRVLGENIRRVIGVLLRYQD
jgi:hypothetical protein